MYFKMSVYIRRDFSGGFPISDVGSVGMGIFMFFWFFPLCRSPWQRASPSLDLIASAVLERENLENLLHNILGKLNGWWDYWAQLLVSLPGDGWKELWFCWWLREWCNRRACSSYYLLRRNLTASNYFLQAVANCSGASWTSCGSLDLSEKLNCSWKSGSDNLGCIRAPQRAEPCVLCQLSSQAPAVAPWDCCSLAGWLLWGVRACADSLHKTDSSRQAWVFQHLWNVLAPLICLGLASVWDQ